MVTRDKVLELRAQGKSYREIGKEIGCSKSTISYYVGVKKGPQNPKGDKTCKHCGKSIGGYQTFCDSICNLAYRKAQRIERVKSGEVAWNHTIRPALIDLHGNKCALCPTTNVWNGQELTLHVDHLDGNSDNNGFDNLRLICPNCHSQLETTKNRTKKNTRRNTYLREFKGYKQD